MHFIFEQTLKSSRDDLFAFHADPANLARLNAGQSQFQLLHHDGNIHPGATTRFRQKIAGILPVVLGFRHTIYEPPNRFGEEMIHGPCKQFTHLHEFEQSGDGTLIRDRLEVQLPWYLGGELGMRLVAAPLIRRAFARRQQGLRELIEA